ncbi:hypothetical protein BC937DRAFT_89378 [Endogone sp. FLAS-F59071]|nr:hypothetical protein BC937DRAFT_89378 [Endogone sp. FLAS-F59071]|eukprot:RUS17884.1 hypothetical protein BC937DRAFT_89378 [Endogone sp. FLAS-F59071]
MLPAPWYILLVAALVLVFPLLVVPAYIAFYLLRQRPPTIIFDDILLLLKYGPLYNTFTDESFQFFIVILVHKLFLGMMVGLFQFSGISQAVVIIFLEVLLFLALYFKRPYADEAINALYLFFDAMRIVISVLNLLYVDQVGLSDDIKQYIAYAQVFLHCVAFLVLLAIPAKNLVAMCMGITSEEATTEVQRRHQSSLRGNSMGRRLATKPQKEVWRRSGSASNIVLSSAVGGHGGLNGTSGMSGNGFWGVSGVSGEEDIYYPRDRRDSLGADDAIAWNAVGSAAADGRPVSGYDDYGVVMTQQMQNAPTGAPGPMRRASVNDNLTRTQSVGGFGGVGGFYRHSRKSMRRMSKTLDDLAAQAGAVAAYQAGASQSAYADGQIGSNPGGYYSDGSPQPRRSELGVELQQLAPPSRICNVCGALSNECGCDHSTASSSAPMITTRQKSLGLRASPGPNIVHLSRSGTNSSNGSDADLGNGNRRSGTATPLSPEEAFAMTTSGALFQSRGGSEVESEGMGSQGKGGGKDSFPSRK